MNKKIITKLIYIVIVAVMVFAAFSSFAEIDVRLYVGGCNNDLICQPDNGEDVNNCSTDCSLDPEPQPTSTPTTTTSTRHPSSGSSIVYSDILISTTYDAAFITWKTQKPTQGVLSWGNNTDYADGSVAESKFGLDHIAKIGNLKSGKVYNFSITMHDGSGNSVVYAGSFRTQSITQAALPPNVLNLTSFEAENGIGLKWQNPDFIDFSYIRVLRSIEEYPLDPLDGRIVYEGGSQSFVDINVEDGILYYYSVFVRSKTGYYSSGSLISETKNISSIPNPLDSENGVPILETPIDTSGILHPLIPIYRISFIQDDEDISFAGNSIPIDGSKSLYISIPKELVPNENEVFIAIATKEKEIPILLYLLRYNEATKSIEGEIPAFERNEIYSFTMQTLNNGIFNQITSGNFVITFKEVVSKITILSIILLILEFIFMYWYLFLLLLLIILFLIMRKFIARKER